MRTSREIEREAAEQRSLSPIEADLLAARHEIKRLRAVLESIAGQEMYYMHEPAVRGLTQARGKAAAALEAQPLTDIPKHVAADDVELEWRDTDERRFNRTEDRSPITFLRRVVEVRDVLGMMWQSVDTLDPDDVRDMFDRLDDAVADFRGDRPATQLTLGATNPCE